MSLIVLAHAARQRQAALLSGEHFAGSDTVFPSTFYGLFPPFPDNNRVFVAMPFGARFGLRWEHVIRKGIEAAGLEAHRVDLSKIADSIPLKILQEIGRCRLVFADVTTENGVRNGNVMYELGIAQAMRRPEEVIVFRSDSDSLPFDIAPIFADTYHPDDGPSATEAAVQQIKIAIDRAIESIDLTRHLIVQKIVDALDVPTFEVLASYLPPPFQNMPEEVTLGKAVNDSRLLSGFSRLVSVGVLRTSLPDFMVLYEAPGSKAIASDLVFRLTPLGKAVAKEFTSRYYRGRSPRDAYREFVRITGVKFVADGKITQEQADGFTAEAASGDETALARLRTVADAG